MKEKLEKQLMEEDREVEVEIKEIEKKIDEFLEKILNKNEFLWTNKDQK